MSVSARWAAGIACVEVTYTPPGRGRRTHLRLALDEARALRAELDSVIAEREPDDEGDSKDVYADR